MTPSTHGNFCAYNYSFIIRDTALELPNGRHGHGCCTPFLGLSPLSAQSCRTFFSQTHQVYPRPRTFALAILASGSDLLSYCPTLSFCSSHQLLYCCICVLIMCFPPLDCKTMEVRSSDLFTLSIQTVKHARHTVGAPKQIC